MITVKVGLGARSYHIHIQSGLMKTLPTLLRSYRKGGKTLILTDVNVKRKYGPLLKRLLDADTVLFTLPTGENSKRFSMVEAVLTRMFRKRFDRSSLLVALGGGVVGDIGGFAASLFMRGISYVQVPTTLLAQVDSSVGGKTGVNHPLGKNLIGTFHQPRAVFIDTDFLKTLPVRELISGFAEVIKHGIIRRPKLFGFLESNLSAILERDPKALEEIVSESCRIKADVVSRDEKEKDLRAILNFGHTYAHAVETVTGYRCYTHGEAVMLGMAAACHTAVALKLTAPKTASRILALLKETGMPAPVKAPANQLYRAMFSDKKAKRDRLNMIFPVRIGRAEIIHSPDRAAVLAGLNAIIAKPSAKRAACPS